MERRRAGRVPHPCDFRQRGFYYSFIERDRAPPARIETGASCPQTRYTTLWYYHNVEFIESRPFSRKLQQFAGDNADEVLRSIQADLVRNPDRGAMVPGLGGVRKVRMANPGRSKGKRGGFRYLYLYLERKQHIHLLLLLDKNEQEDATEEQRKQMREWTGKIKRESGD